MKKNIFYIALAAFMAIACVEENLNNEINPMEGDEVLFSATSGNRIETRTTYGDEVQGTNGNQIIVNWVNGDKVKVWASAIASRNEAEYAVNTGGNSQNFAESLNKTGSYGIQWGSETSSNFCAIYPSDNLVKLSDGSSAFSENGNKITVKTKIDSVQNSVFVPITAQNQTTAKLDTVGWTGAHFGQDAVTPSMQSALMFARTNGAVPYESDKVTPKPVDLHFKPFTTALKVKFAGYTSNLTNPTVYVQNIVVKAPKGVSIAGNFDIDITGSGISANAAISSISKTKGEFANSITINTMLKDGLFLPLKPSQEVTFNVFAIPQSYTMDGTDNLWTVTINTQGHGSFTYKMKPKAGVDGYTLTAGAYHKVKIPNLEVKTEIPWNPENWITQIPVPVYISELSVPGAWYCTNGDYQSTTNLSQQYKAGIRAFNIDCRLTYKSGRSGDMDLYCAGSEGSNLGSITSEGKTVLKALEEIAALIPEDEYVVVVLTIAEKPKTDSGRTLGTVDPEEVLKSIATLIQNNGKALGVYGYTDSTLDKTITANTTIDEVLDHMIIKVNINTIANAGTQDQGLLGVTGFLNYTTIPNTLISYASMAPETTDDIVIGVYDKMQTSPIYWGKEDASLSFHFHQAQRTTYSGTYEEQEWSWDSWSYVTVTKSYEVDGVPTYEERMSAIDNIIAQSKEIYDSGTHDAWFQIGIGGSRKNSNDGDTQSSRTEIAERLNPYLYGKIASKMDIDPSPVGIVLMNFCTSDTDYTAIVDGKSYEASSKDLVQAIIEMNGKFYLNRLGSTITTGGQGGNGGTPPTPAPAKNAAYAEVGEDAF